MRIRLLEEAELSLLGDIERAAGRCFSEIGMDEIADDAPPAVDELVSYQRAGMAWAAVSDQDLPIGYLLAEIVDGNLHVEQVSVHPDHAGQRVGRRLIDHAVARAAAWRLPAVTLTTFEEVPWNAPYYRRCGFRILAEDELTPGLVAIRHQERERGFDRWPRVCMIRPA